MDRLSILVLHETFGEGCPGGSTRVFHETSKRLAETGHHVVAICQEFPPGSGVPEDGVEYIRYKDISGSELARFRHRRAETRRAFDTACGKKCPDAVIAHSGLSALGLPDTLSNMGIPVLYYFHSPWHLEHEANIGLATMTPLSPRWIKGKLASRLRRKIEAEAARAAWGVATLSQSMRELAVDIHPFLSDKPSKVIFGGADPAVFHPAKNAEETRKTREKHGIPDDAFVIISSRRLVPRTGVDNLVKAFAESASKLPEGAMLVLTGDGPLRDELSRMAEKMSIGNQVVFTGHVPEEDLAALYRASDLFVMPSRELEGFGLSTVEAMASGIPAVGTDIGGTKEVLEKVSEELLIPGTSHETIADKLVEFANSKDIAAWGERCLNAAKTHFTWDAHTESLLDFIQELASSNRRQP